MKKSRVLLFSFLCLCAFQAPAQQLKVDFNQVDAGGAFTGGSLNQAGFEPFNMQHETIGEPFDVIRTETFASPWGDLDVSISTDADPNAANLATVYQAIARSEDFVPDYNGTMLELARDWTGLDSRSAGATTYTITISGLPAGAYDFLSYHQDIQNQTGQFNVAVNGALAHENVDIRDSTSGQNPGAGNPPFYIITPIDADGSDVAISFELTSVASTAVVDRFFVLNGFVLAARGEAALLASFEANPSNPYANETVEFSWQVSPDSQVALEPGSGDVTGQTTNGAGSITRSDIGETTTFTLTVTKDGETASREITVEVRSDIVSFEAAPANLADGETSTLSWEVNPAASVSIEPGLGDVTDQTSDGAGSIDVSPSETTEYVLTTQRGGDSETAAITVSVVGAPTNSTLGEDLIAYWPLDELRGTKTPDLVNGLDMEAGNITEANIVEGRFGNAISFINGDQTILTRVHEAEDALPANQYESFTVSFWANVNGMGQNDLRMFSEGSTESNDPLFNIGTDNTGATAAVDVFIRNNGTEINHAQSMAQPLDGQDWHHIVFVQENGERRLYVDGVLDGVALAAKVTEVMPVNNTSIGGIQRATTCCLVTGLIDEVAIWSRSLTEDEIVELNVNNLDGVFDPVARGLVAHWPLDEILGSKTPDLVNGLDMDVNNLTQDNIVAGQFNNAFSFVNADQTILTRTHAANDPLPINQYESFTVSFWANVNGVGQSDLRMFSEGSTESNDPLFNIGTDNTGATAAVDVYVRNNGVEINHALSAVQPLDGQEWHHIVFVQENGERRLYIDGVLDGVALAAKVTEVMPVNNTSIGGIQRATNCCLVTGLIDDVALWNRALGEDEIAQINVNGVPAVLSPTLPLEIRKFTADYATVERGGTATLRWDVNQDAQISINQGIGDVTDASQFGVGSLEVTVDEPTVYQLTLTRDGEQVSAQTTVEVLDGVAPGWRLLENFDSRPNGNINLIGGWKAPNGNTEVIDLGVNKVLGFTDGELITALDLTSQSIPVGESATVFMRAYLSPSESVTPITLNFGLTERPIRFVGDFAANVGPFLRLEKLEGQDEPVDVLARDGLGAELTLSDETVDFGVVYNIWFDIENRPVAEGDIFSIYIQEEGAAERTLLFDGFVADRDPTVDPFFGPPLPELKYLFFAIFGTGQGTEFLFYDDFFISSGGLNDTIPVEASSFEFVEQTLNILLSGAMNPEGFTVTWNSLIGDSYAVESTGDFSAWDRLVEDYPEGGAVSTVTSYTDSDVGSANKYYRVVYEPPPALFFEDFETGAAGWSVNTVGLGATAWELGTPANGPDMAHSGDNLYGTDLDADYEFYTDTLLNSPVIDLTGISSATLTFWYFLDTESFTSNGELFDYGEVHILNPDGTVLAESIFRRNGTTADWRSAEVEIPEEALGGEIMLQFRLVGDEFNPLSGETQAGWFIDDVAITP